MILDKDVVTKSIDFEDILSYRCLCVINMKNKVRCIIKYILYDMYMQDTLICVISHISDELMLINLIDKSLCDVIWKEAFDCSLDTYFLSFIMKYKDSIYQNSDSMNNNSKIGIHILYADIFEREMNRLFDFYCNMLDVDIYNKIKNKGILMVRYLRSKDEHSIMSTMNDMIEHNIIKNDPILVGV